MEGPGPYSVKQGEEIAKHLGLQADIATAAVFSDHPAAFVSRLLAGRPQIILFKHTPSFGHFVLAHRLPSGNLEFYDSQSVKGETLDEFLLGHGDTSNLNGPAGWLGEALAQAAGKENVRVEYNRSAPQGKRSNSCLLHTLARALVPGVPAKTFVKKADRFFVKHYAEKEKQKRHSR